MLLPLRRSPGRAGPQRGPYYQKPCGSEAGSPWAQHWSYPHANPDIRFRHRSGPRQPDRNSPPRTEYGEPSVWNGKCGKVVVVAWGALAPDRFGPRRDDAPFLGQCEPLGYWEPDAHPFVEIEPVNSPCRDARQHVAEPCLHANRRALHLLTTEFSRLSSFSVLGTGPSRF